MNESYSVAFDVERLPTFQRAHVFLRVALLVLIVIRTWRRCLPLRAT